MWVAQISIIQEKSLIEVFQNIDVKALRSANESKNNIVGLIVQNSLANKIASFFFFKKNVDIRSKFINDQLGLITLGLLFTAREYQEAASSHTVQSARAVMPPDPWTCFQAAVSTVIGLTQAQALWQSIVGGATVQTVVDALILIGRRVAGVISVGLMVVAVGDCLGCGIKFYNMIKVVLDWIFIFLFFLGGFTHMLKLAHLLFGFSFLENITAFSSKEDSKTLKVCYYLLAISTALFCILTRLGYYQIVRI